MVCDFLTGSVKTSPPLTPLGIKVFGGGDHYKAWVRKIGGEFWAFFDFSHQFFDAFCCFEGANMKVPLQINVSPT